MKFSARTLLLKRQRHKGFAVIVALKLILLLKLNLEDCQAVRMPWELGVGATLN